MRLEVYDYTCTSILTIGKYEALVNAEIARVKSLSLLDRIAQKWAGSIERPEGTLWMEDSLDWIKGIGAKKSESLKKANITKLKDLCELEDDGLRKVQKISRIGVKSLRNYQESALKASPGVSPFPKSFDWVTGLRIFFLEEYWKY